MPTVNVPVKHFNKCMGRSFTNAELETLCFEYGIEVEFPSEEEDQIQQEQNKQVAKKVKQSTAKQTSENKDLAQKLNPIEQTYQFEVASNRADLLGAEGIIRALRIFLDQEKIPLFMAKPHKEKIIVKAATKHVRPYVVGAILRDVTFTLENYNSFIDLQDKLHHNLCRKRTLVAIGTHDLDTIKGPFVYTAEAPTQLSFVPLNQTEKMNGTRLMEFYSTDLKLREYLPIIRDQPVYPIIYDANGVVLSLPPIINGDHSKLTLHTKNVFIESTATDLTRAHVALNAIVGMFSQYCKDPFTVEEVEIIYEEAPQLNQVTPVIKIRHMTVSIAYVNTLININISADEAVKYLAKMGVHSRVSSQDKQEIEVDVDIMRNGDMLHPCDIAEEIAIGYGFNKVEAVNLNSFAPAKQQIQNKFCDLLRHEMAMAGYAECLNFILCSFADMTDKMGSNEQNFISIGNPMSAQFQTARTMLLPGLLKTLHSNIGSQLPLQLFEIGDVVLKSNNDIGAKNERHLAAVHSNHSSSGFDLIHGLLDHIMVKVSVPFHKPNGYYIQLSDQKTYFPGKQAEIFFQGQKIGIMGILHPLVIEAFDWKCPAAAIEINLEPIISKYFNEESYHSY